MRVLILGGTTEASALARRLADDVRFAAMLSLAGRTRAPALPPIPCRIGGFGGAAGLARFLTDERIAALVDATHPFAAQISANAQAAAQQAGVPLLAVVRPPWERQEGDHWIDVASMKQAAAALGEVPKRAFLTVGQQELAAFTGTPHQFFVRSVDKPDAGFLPGAVFFSARGPFLLQDELLFLQHHGIEVLVTKNSGGTATAAKLEAARLCRIPVVMVARPPTAGGVADADAAFAWLQALHASRRGA